MKKEQVIENLKEEYAALKGKYERLLNALNDEDFIKEVGEEQIELLLDQESIMRLYMKTLMLRIGNLVNNSSVEKEQKEPKKECKKECKKEDPSKDRKKDEEEIISAIKDFLTALKEGLQEATEKEKNNMDEIISYYVKI